MSAAPCVTATPVAVYDSQAGYADVRLSWWRNNSDRRYWSLTAVDARVADLLMDMAPIFLCVMDDFGDLVRVR